MVKLKFLNDEVRQVHAYSNELIEQFRRLVNLIECFVVLHKVNFFVKCIKVQICKALSIDE